MAKLAHEHVGAPEARRLLMLGLGLLEWPAASGRRPVARAATSRLVSLLDQLGFVQLDSINIVERAHHHILWTRWPGYQPAMLDALYEQALAFEHWTHDASLIPVRFFPHWRPRFERYREAGAWMRERLGPDAPRVIASVLERIGAEGPLMSKDFAPAQSSGAGAAVGAGGAGGWWNWKPQKAALEYLWRTGELAVARRVNFHKVYDLTERVLPEVAGLPAPSPESHIDWCCSSAIDRLGIATPREISAFWNDPSLERTRAWCDAAAREGRIVPVTVDPPQDAKSRLYHAFAAADWKERLARAPEPTPVPRLLSPFDPLLRDRLRALRLFNFDYRFEAFTPAAKRKYGYYVLPILEGDRLVGRADPQLDRAAGKLEVRLWWEQGIRPTRSRTSALEEAVEVYAKFNSAESWTLVR
jgi:uncharacterized protein